MTLKRWSVCLVKTCWTSSVRLRNLWSLHGSAARFQALSVLTPAGAPPPSGLLMANRLFRAVPSVGAGVVRHEHAVLARTAGVRLDARRHRERPAARCWSGGHCETRLLLTVSFSAEPGSPRCGMVAGREAATRVPPGGPWPAPGIVAARDLEGSSCCCAPMPPRTPAWRAGCWPAPRAAPAGETVGARPGAGDRGAGRREYAAAPAAAPASARTSCCRPGARPGGLMPSR